MDKLLIETLKPLGYPVKLQGSLSPKDHYPKHFFTYWNDSADGSSFYSNEEGALVWAYSLNFYSIDPLLVNSMLLTAKTLLKEAGFIVHGAGYSVASDEQSHTGRGITVLYRQEQ